MEQIAKRLSSIRRTHRITRSRRNSNIETSEHHMNNNEDEKAKKNSLKNSKYIFMSISLIIITFIASLCLFRPILNSNELPEQEAIRNEFLSRKILSVDDFKVYYEDKPDKSSWEKLPDNLKQRILNSKLNFQGQSVDFKSLLNTVVLNTLTFNEINEILKGTELIIGTETSNKVEFYIERRFMHEDAKMMYFEYEYGHEYVESYENPFEFAKNRTKGRTFKEFYDKFKNQSDRFEIIEKIRQNEFFQKLAYDLNEENFHFFNVSSDEIVEEANKERILVLMSELGSGKTTTLKQIAMEIKNKFPTKWVSYVDLKSHEKFYKTGKNVDNVQDLLIHILGLNTGKTDFEIEIFKESFKSGNVVLFWDDFDKISPDFQNFILNLFKLIHKNTTSIQFMSTKQSHSDQLRKKFNTRPVVILSFDREQQQEFLRKYFISQNLPSEKVQEKVDITRKIFEKLYYKDDFVRDFNTPTNIKLIVELYKDESLYQPENIYKIFENIIQNKINLWIDENESLVGSLSKNSITQLLKKTLQKYAFLNELDLFATAGGIVLKMLKLELMQKDLPQGWSFDKISQMQIFIFDGKKDLKFFHETLSDFLIAQYLIENIFNIDGRIDSDEAELRLEIFSYITQSYGNFQQIITDFMTSFLKTRNINDDKPFNSEISSLLRTKFKNLFIRTLDTNEPKVFEFLYEFFEKDYSLLTDLLHVHEDETFYTAIFNPSHFALFTNPVEIKNLSRKYLTEHDFDKFVTGNDQKGVILMGMHFYSLLNVSTSDDVHSAELESLKSGNFSYWEFLNEIKESLTLNEQKQLFVALANPKIYLYYDTLFSTSDFSKYQKLWSSVESLSTKSQLSELLGNSFINYLEALPIGHETSKPGQENFLNLLLNKTENFLSNCDIYEMFLVKNIFHEAVWGDFTALWNFFKNHTTNEQRRTILLQDDLDDKNFYFHSSYIEAKENFSSSGYSYYPFDFTAFKIFHRSLLRPTAPTYDLTIEIYQNHFNRTELQKIILSSRDFLAYAMIKTEREPFEKFTSFLEEFFKGNEKALKEYLDQKIKPTNLSVLEFVGTLTRFNSLYFDLPSNIKMLTDLFNKL